MEFDKLRLNSNIVTARVAKVIALCQDIAANGPKEISTDGIELVVGQGETGRILRQVLKKQKNAASKKGVPATWDVDKEAFLLLCQTCKDYGAKRTRAVIK